MQPPHHSRVAASMRRASALLCFLCGVLIMLGYNTLRGSDAETKTAPQHIYELRVYHVKPGKLQALTARFADHTDALFQRHNMTSIGYWQPDDAPATEPLLVYVLQHPSRAEAEKNWAAFQADPDWKKVKADSEANGPLVDHIDRYFMHPTTFSALK
jgi:NIPSNAP